ncbi:MAG: sigma-70 family RNA polymerase sigma factor [Crocinitomicaceae bacterium]|nr:sigma-70 family RNA polymerase sigma factor [Crocinitomicaceae bacterium]
MLFGLFFRKKISDLEDAALLKLVQQNDHQAMGELFNRYSWLVMGQCLKYLKNRMEAEDMMMTLFDKLPEKIKKNEVVNFKTWLYSVSKNECLMHLRKKNIKESDAETALLFKEDESETQFRITELKEQKLKLLEEAIEKLNHEQKRCIELFYLKDHSYDEIVSITKFELSKVKSYIQNGKRNLKLILENKREFNQ